MRARKSMPSKFRLAFQAFFGLLAYDLAGFNANFQKMHDFVLHHRLSLASADSDATSRVSEAVNAACVWYPKRVLCLQRSAVTTCLLRHWGVEARMVLGAQIFPFKAHAWTEVAGQAINERKDVQQIYSILEYV